MNVNSILNHTNATPEKRKELRSFYEQSAVSALQGLMEQGGALGTAEDWLIPPKVIAAKAFEIADAMLEEYIKRY